MNNDMKHLHHILCNDYKNVLFFSKLLQYSSHGMFAWALETMINTDYDGKENMDNTSLKHPNTSADASRNTLIRSDACVCLK